MDKYEILNKYFGYEDFRYPQVEVIDSLVNRKNTIAIIATGGGKSICFQIPALMAGGTTLVVTPLISLMYDQVMELKKKNIGAAYINSSISKYAQLKIYEDLRKGKIKILYISPERLSNEVFINFIKNITISYLIVDEAHTILWHMDFRESFLNIKKFIRMFSYDICLGLFSATANTYTLREIKRVVGVYNFNLITSTFDRPELFYMVVRNKNKLEFIENYLESHKSSGIIYCQTRKECEAIYNNFKDRYKMSYYHGGLSDEMKEKNQNLFLNDDIIMVSTISFGMGINKSNIRFVINYNIPDSIESLSQMFGRCSRDRLYGECIVLYNDGDTKTLNYFIRSIDTTTKSYKEINNVKKYKYITLNRITAMLRGNGCLHQGISRYFGEKIKPCGDMCSNCKKLG